VAPNRSSADPSRPRRGESVTWGYFGDEIVAFHEVSKQYFVLSAVAARIFELSTGDTPMGSLAERLAVEFEAPLDAVAADVQSTVAGLEEFGLLTR
jgi:hypothetical protein